MRKLTTVLALSLTVVTGVAGAESFPTKPLTIIVPQGAGGGTDVVTRALAEVGSKILNQQIIVENRPSAGGIMGTQYVAKRVEPDGYTILMGGTTPNAVAPALDPAVGYDTLEDFEPLGLVYTAPNVLVIPSVVPAKSLEDFLKLVRATPGKYNYSTNGIGSYYHLGIAYLLSKAGNLKMVHVPYKGSNEAVRAVLANEVQLTLSSYAAVLPHIKAGTIRPIAHTGKVRNPVFPDLPTAVESGFPDFLLVAHVAAMVPKETPRDRVAILRKVFSEANLSESMTALYRKLGSVQERVQAGEYEPFIIEDVRRFREAAKVTGLYKGK